MNRPQNPQEWLDKLIQTSLENNFPSLDDDGDVCRYRGRLGRECAIGVVIPDELYDKAIEGADASYVVEQSFCLPKWVREFSVAALKEVQSTHDLTAYNGQWNHAEFMERLRDCEIFKGCKFPEEVAA